MNYGEPCSLVNANAILGSTLADAVLTLESSEKLEQLLQSISTERGKNYSVNDFHVAVFSADANQCIDDLSGCCMAYGGKFEYVNLTWQAILNKQEITSIQGAELHRQLLKKANGGGGWHNYPWSKSTGNAQTKRALVARFRSGNLTYYAVAEYLNSTLPPTCDNCGDGKECTQDDQEFCAQIPDRSAQRLGETFASVFVPVCVAVGVVALIVWYRYRKRMQEQEEELRKRMQEKEEELQRMAEQLREEMRGMWEVVKDLPIQSPGAYAREVQQREGGDSILPHTAALWYWEENRNLVSSHNASTVLRGTRFVCYPREISEVLEESFAEFKNDERSREVLFELSTSNSLTGVQYAVNFQTFKQRNVATGYERTVCREEVPIPIEPEVIGRLPQLPDDIDFSDDGEALLPTFKGQIIQVSKHHISGLWLYGNVLYDPLLNAVHLQSQAADATATALNPLMVNALHDRPTSGWFPRSVTKPADAKALQKLLKNFGGEGADILAPPDTWVTIDNSTSTPYRNGMVEVDAQSEECKAVVTSFIETMGKRRRFIIVTNVERIQNLPLWQSYAVMRQIILTRDIDTPHHRINNLNLTDIERKCLFHGTCSDVVPKIVTQGFNRAFAGRHAVRYGKGVYFARDASYSSNETFSAPDSDGIQRMFLCRAIVGDWCQGVEGQLTPDAKPHNALELFDSTVDDVSNPSIFVIYHDAQSFPAYLISFRDTRRAT
ncbi:platelet-activating factor acetyltransferase [Fragilaria crotonensis]|nr:platelet-activating factor acetyltransferase [Fragilaria crotonensis]